MIKRLLLIGLVFSILGFGQISSYPPIATISGTSAANDVICADAGGNAVACDTTDAIYSGTLLTIPSLRLDIDGAFGEGTGISFGDGNTEIYESADNNLYFTVGGVKMLEIGGSQDVLIRDTTPTSGDTSFKIRAGANQGTYLTQWVGSSGDRMAVTVAGDGIVMANTAALFVRGYGGTWASSEHIVFDAINNFTDTDGVAQEFMVTKPNFAPTSGAVTFTDLTLETIINQTGGASGITRGLYINPTLTAAADFRALEVAAGKSVFGDIVQFENNTTQPADCVPAIYGAVYFNTTDNRLCVCVDDGDDDEWVKSDDYTHGGGHCSIP